MASCFAGCLALLVLSRTMSHQWHFAYFSLLYLKIKRCFKQVGGYSTAFCFRRHRFFFLLHKFYFAEVMNEKRELRLTGGGMGGTCFPRELWEDMGKVGSKASVQSHQLDEGFFFFKLEHRSLSMSETSWAGTVKKHTGTWNQDYRHIEIGDIHKGDSWLLAGNHSMCRGHSPYVCQLVVPGEGRLYYLPVQHTLRIL